MNASAWMKKEVNCVRPEGQGRRVERQGRRNRGTGRRSSGRVGQAGRRYKPPKRLRNKEGKISGF